MKTPKFKILVFSPKLLEIIPTIMFSMEFSKYLNSPGTISFEF